jgi:hypothetical protein
MKGVRLPILLILMKHTLSPSLSPSDRQSLGNFVWSLGADFRPFFQRQNVESALLSYVKSIPTLFQDKTSGGKNLRPFMRLTELRS